MKFKVGSRKRRNVWIQVVHILNAIKEPKFRVNQRAVWDRYNLFQKAFKKKMAEKEKDSGIHLPELTDMQRGIQEILEKFREVQNKNTHNVYKSKSVEMRPKGWATISETRDWVEDEVSSPNPKRKRGNTKETFAFLMSKEDTESEYKMDELRLNFLTRQQKINKTIFEHFQQQIAVQQQQSQQMMMVSMNSQHQ